MFVDVIFTKKICWGYLTFQKERKRPEQLGSNAVRFYVLPRTLTSCTNICRRFCFYIYIVWVCTWEPHWLQRKENEERENCKDKPTEAECDSFCFQWPHQIKLRLGYRLPKNCQLSWLKRGHLISFPSKHLNTNNGSQFFLFAIFWILSVRLEGVCEKRLRPKLSHSCFWKKDPRSPIRLNR